MTYLKKTIKQWNADLLGSGYQLKKTNYGVSVYNEGGDFLFSRKTLERAILGIRKIQDQEFRDDVTMLLAGLADIGDLTGAANRLQPGWQDEFYAMKDTPKHYGVLDHAVVVIRERITRENFSDIEKLVETGKAAKAKMIEDEVERQAATLLRKRRLGTILAAIRLWQKTVSDDPRIDQSLEDIATDSGEFEPLDVVEIDELCEELNCGNLLSNA